jgi:stearoyl-CoA desaturase (delta-9 desaturase)
MKRITKSEHRWNYTNLFWISLVHLLAISAILKFSWENLEVALFGIFVLAPLGINIGYHRLLCHRSFSTPTWVRYTLATIGVALGGGPPIHWVAMHRVHHRYSDSDLDPHNSRKGFWYSHILHLFVVDDHETGQAHLKTFAPDLSREPYLVWLNQHWLWPALGMLVLLYVLGGLGWVLWGGFVRLAVTWHIMWFVNSASHLWGYRNYPTKDKSMNCWWVGILAAGEGWHNNRHAQPACAAHGHRWWELDQSFFFIRILEILGLATDVKRPLKGMEEA